MEITTENQLQTFFSAYKELDEIFQNNDLQKITSDSVLYRATERLLAILAIATKRLQKLNPDWQIPQYKAALRVKNYVIWDNRRLRPSYLLHLKKQVFDQIYAFLSEKQQTLSSDET